MLPSIDKRQIHLRHAVLILATTQFLLQIREDFIYFANYRDREQAAMKSIFEWKDADSSVSSTITNNRYDIMQPTIGRGMRRPYSNHFCVGPYVNITSENRKYGDNSIPELRKVMRSCHFTDVCFDQNGTLLYYVNDDTSNTNNYDNNIEKLADELETITHGQDHWKGPDHVRPRKIHQLHRNSRLLRPQIVRGPRPEEFSTWSESPLAIPYLPSHLRNFGHCLLDNVMSFFRLMKLFGLYSQDMDSVPLRMVGTDNENDKYFITSMLSKVLDPFLAQSALEDSAESYYFPTYFSKQSQKLVAATDSDKKYKNLCFENVISGKYMHTDHGLDESQHGWALEKTEGSTTNPFLVGRGDQIREFRDEYMIRMGMNPYMRRDIEQSSIIVIPRPPDRERDGHQTIGWNHESLKMNLVSCFEKNSKFNSTLLDNNNISVLDVEKASVREQLRVVSSAKVLISMRGGGSLLSIFLAQGATLLLLDREKDSLLDDMLYDNIPYFHVITEPASSTIPEYENFYDHESICQKVMHAIYSYDMSHE